MQQTVSHNAPSSAIVIPHFIFGGLTWLSVTLLIFFYPESVTQHFFNPQLLSITHLLVLGWITMVIFGALYQLIPVILEVKLFSETVAVLTFILLASGTILLALAFWNFWLGMTMYIAASILFVAVGLFVTNIIITAKKSLKKSIEKKFIQTSVIWLFFTVSVGVMLAINLTHPFLSTPHLELLKLHAHAGIVGWFLQLIIGVASRLFPMFMVSHELTKKKLTLSYYLINGGLALGILCLFFQWNVGIISAIILVISGVISFLSFIAEAVKKRVKKQLDIGMKQSVISFLILTISLIILLILLVGTNYIEAMSISLIIGYGTTLLIGFISSLIMGQTYKTLPFIVWLKVYRGKVGKGKIPFPKDLYSEKIAIAQLWSFAIGFTLLLTGIFMVNEIFVRSGATVLLFSVTLYNSNLLKIVFHKAKNSNG